jgi:hypothetical protein
LGQACNTLLSVGCTGSGLRFQLQLLKGRGVSLPSCNINRTLVPVDLNLVDW